MKLPHAPWRTRPGMAPLLRALGAQEGDTRFVGGCVRDTLLGIEVADVDLATRLTPQDVIRRLERARIKAVPTGIAHGTVTAISAGTPVEVTTLRRDVTTDGRHATVAFTDDWREDAARRDFTINALSAEPGSGNIHDYFGGLADLEERRVRFIGDPLTRIAEDHLRILRFFRFHARFGRGEPDEAGLEACTARANDLMALSRERIAGELLRLLSLDNPAATVRLMVDRGILKPVLPEIGMDGVARLERVIEREGGASEPVRRLAALLPNDPGVAASVAARLRLSNDMRDRLILYASPADLSLEPRHLAFRIGTDRALSLLILSDVPAEKLTEARQALNGWRAPKFPIKGGELIALGLPEGPLIARTLNRIKEEWCAAGFPPKERARELARAAVDQALRSSQ